MIRSLGRKLKRGLRTIDGHLDRVIHGLTSILIGPLPGGPQSPIGAKRKPVEDPNTETPQPDE